MPIRSFALVAAMVGVAACTGVATLDNRVMAQNQKVAEPPRLDLYGDPLPAGAMARLGTARFRMSQNSHALALSPDGNTMATAGKFISVWDLATGKELLRFKAGPLRALIYADDGKALVGVGTLGPDDIGKVHVWDAATGKKLRQFTGHVRGGVTSVVYDHKDRRVISGGEDNTIRVCDYDTGKLIRTLTRHKNTVRLLALSPGGEMLASAHSDGIVRLWDYRAGKELHVLNQSRGRTDCLSLTHDGRMLVTESGEHAHLWDTATGKEIRRIKGPFGSVGSAVFTRDGKTLITGGYLDTIRYWETETGKELRNFDKFTNCFHSLGLSRDEKLLVATCDESRIFIWDAETGKPIVRDHGHEARGSSVAYSPDGKFVVTVGLGSTVRFWDPRTGKQTRTFELTGGPKRFVPEYLGHPIRIEFSSLGKLLVSSNNDPDAFVSVSDPVAGKELYRHKGAHGTFSPDGKLVASAEMEPPPKHGVARLYDAETGKLVREVHAHRYGIDRIAFLAGGKTFATQGSVFLAALSDDDSRDDALGIVRYWDVATGKLVKQGPHSQVGLGIMSPDGRTKVLGDQVWEVATGQKRATLQKFPKESETYPYVMASSPDGRMLAGGDLSGTIRLWAFPSCKEIGRLDGHRGRVLSLAFAPDGKNLASSSWDTSVLIWDLASFREKAEPERLEADQLRRLWQNLGSDAETAYRAIKVLATSPKQAIGLMEEHLSPVATPDSKEVDRLLSDLASERYAVREKANAALERMGTSIESALRKTLAGKPSLEVRRRINTLIEKTQILSAKDLREIRAVELLEYLAANDLLKKLAAGAPDARLTREAKATWERLQARALLVVE